MLPAFLRFHVLPLALFAVSNHSIDVSWMLFEETYIQWLLVAICFLAPLIAGAKSCRFSKVVGAMALCFAASLTLVMTYEWLTFGVLFCLAAVFTMSHIFEGDFSTQVPPQIKVFQSPLLGLIYMVLFQTYLEENSALYFLGTGLLSYSTLSLSSTLQSRFNLLPKIALLILPGLYFFDQLFVIKIISWVGLAWMFLGLLTKASRDQLAQSLQDILVVIFKNPSLVIVGYFVLIATAGSIMLHLPISQASATGVSHTYVDSLFTAMSAVSVTGLGVLDTANDFSFVGQVIILTLIQLGGLGIAFLSAWILFLNKDSRLSVSHEDLLQSIAGTVSRFKSRDLLKRVISYFLLFETVGAVFLVFIFWNHQDGFMYALWRGIFTSISAFCNAGFALQSDSLIQFQSMGSALSVMSILIIFGGFAPLMVSQWPNKVRNRNWSLQDKLSISTTVTLLIMGLLVFAILEWTGTLQGLSTVDKVTNAWFQSVTTRTAGFNSVDLAQAHDLTIVVFLFLMFVGGNPGGAAGGIKTVTLAIIVFATISGLKGHDQIKAFYRSIPTGLLYQSLLIVVLGLGVHFLSFVILSLTQDIPTRQLIFEVFSALGTVGLSIGATPQLDTIGKLVIIACMLAGRVGPLTFLLLVVKNANKKNSNYVSEQVSIT